MAFRNIEKRLISEAVRGKVNPVTVRDYKKAEKVCEAQFWSYGQTEFEILERQFLPSVRRLFYVLENMINIARHMHTSISTRMQCNDSKG